MPEARSEKLVLTYDNTSKTDGAGAQLQRIYGIYSLSRLLGVSYLHTPLGHIGYRGLSAGQDAVAAEAFLAEFNALCRIDSDAMPRGRVRAVRLKRISQEIFQRLAETAADGGLPILVQLEQPYGISDRFPDCYEICKSISPFSVSPEPGPLRLALHVRRGDLSVAAPGRALPDAYYVGVAQNVARVLGLLGIDYVIEIHTEAAAAADGGVAFGSELAAFDVLPNLVHCINERAIDTLRNLATADILVMSRSSFSYVGAILNKNGVVLYHPFWHQPLSSWVVVDADQHFDAARLRDGIEARNGRRSA